MTFLEFLTNYFTITLFSRLIERRTPVSSLTFDKVFTHRANHATARVALTDIMTKTKSMPVIARGGVAIPIDAKKGSTTFIEPLSIRLSDFITGAKLNDLRSLFGNGDENGQALVQAELDNIVLSLMQSTELTRNALCNQAITGKINYMLDSNGMKEKYVIDYGTTNTYNLNTLLDSDSATLVTVLETLNAMRKSINDAGYTGQLMIMCGANAYSTLCNLIMATKEGERMGARITSDTIELLGFQIILNNDTYTDTDENGNEATYSAVDTNKMVMCIPQVAELGYFAIDDVSGNLQAVPFFSRAVPIDDPSGFKVLSESKPLPLVAPKSICWATVTASAGIRPTQVVVNNIIEGKIYTDANLMALTKAKILEIATTRGYEMTKTDADTKEAIITEFISLQTAANG